MSLTPTKAGDRIRFQPDRYGEAKTFTVEEFRQCLGVFESEQDRTACYFTPLCAMYGPGPESTQEYIPNYGKYSTNEIPLWELEAQP